MGGQVAFGGTRANDRSVSTFDQRHVIHGTVIYDLPFGKGRQLAEQYVEAAGLRGRRMDDHGLARMSTGFPYMLYLSDTNQLGDLTHTARPDVNAGVPLVNPLYDRNCPTGTGCQPYLNPSAFMRPALGALGAAPRTLDGVRGPWQQYLRSVHAEEFRIGESGSAACSSAWMR